MASPAQPALLTVRLFAQLREEAGWSERRIPLDSLQPQPTAADLWRRLQLGGPTLPPTVRIAINQRFCDADQRLGAGDELAFLPPISGG